MSRAASKRLVARLGERPELGRERALDELAAGLPRDEVNELADLLELELGLPLGLLRGDDSLRELLAPFPIGNPLTWLFAEGALEDGTSEIGYQLRLRRQARGEPVDVKIETVRDLLVAWCDGRGRNHRGRRR